MSKKMTTRTRTALTLAAVAMAILSLTTTSANAGVISYVQITNDADSGISAGKTYTHKLDFGTGSPGALINGVQFDAYNNAANGTLNFNREVFSGLLSDHAGNAGHNVSGGLVDLMTDMYYNGDNAVGGTTTWTLSGLTAGHTYSTRIYTRQWGANNDRTATIVFDPDGAGPISDSTGPINQDDATSAGFTNANDAYYINYQFSAVAGQDLVITATQNLVNQSWHLYGLTNEIAMPVTKAYGPNPKDGVLYEDIWVNLGWSAGDFAVSHDIYLGDNFDDVNDGTADTFRGNQPLTPTTFFVGFFGCPYPDGLVPGTTYYWRIDEVNDTDPNSPWKGPVWSFWIPPYTAYDSHPPDGAEFIKTDVELSWTAGLDARMNTVYFGDNFDDVNNDVVGIQQADTTYSPGTLELEKTYYWRVDEFDGAATHKGDVLSFKTQPHIPITDPNLIGWWKLDGVASGTAAVDWSGYNHHGTIMGDPVWVIGYDGDALELDGDGDYVDVGSVGIRGMDTRTITGWVRASTRDIPSGTTVFGFAHDGGGDGTYFDIGVDNAGNYGLYIGGWTFPLIAVDTRWHYFAATYHGSGGSWHADGQQINSIEGPIATVDEVRIGARLSNNNYFPGLVDDVRIYNKALTQNEIIEIMRGDPELAYDPGPGRGSMVDVIEATPLSWLPGEKAAQHDVYFGTDKDAVADADTSDTTGIYRGRRVGTSYTPPDVEWGGGPYYWRIDEYNTDATISKGNVWTFTVTDFIKIDDFEDYNDFEPDRIFDTWMDGWGVETNGAEIGYADPDFLAGEHHVETTIVHGGSQSMPYLYDNNFKYSEATYSPTQRDWTEEGVGVLSLWFYGDAANAAERMYVALNSGTAVYHDNANASQIEEWTEWTIDLQTFTGVGLTNVNTLAIGFGDKNNLQAGGTGLVFFDDIRLYRPAP